MSKSFVALDISVNSTGFVIYDITDAGTSLRYGTYKIKAKDDRERRKEYREFLLWLLGGKGYDYIVIEDVIFGNNFETTKALIQLNVVVEDLIDFKLLPDIPVIRLGNTVWKKSLYQLANIEQPNKLYGTDDKECIRIALKLLKFELPENTPQDIYDAMGIVLAYIGIKHSETKISEQQTIQKIHTDLHKGYVLKQFWTHEDAQQYAEKKLKRSKRFNDVVVVDEGNKIQDLEKRFKEVVLQKGDKNIFVVDYKINRVGSILLTTSFDMTNVKERVYFVAHLR